MLHQAALGSVPRSIEDPLAHARRQRDGLPQHAGRRARRRRRALRLRRVELDVWRPSGSAQGRGRDRPSAVALRGDQVRRRALRGGLSPLLRHRRRSACATSTCSAAPGPGRRVRGGDSALGRGDAGRRADHHLRRRRDDPRLLLRRQRGAGQPAGSDSPRPRRDRPGLQRGGRRTDVAQRALCARCATCFSNAIPDCASPPPIHEDFRAGDVRHSQADISKAQRLLGYGPTHDARSGLREALPWYELRLSQNATGLKRELPDVRGVA